MEHHFGVTNSEEWSSPFMEEWFAHIAEQAVDILG
jgi:hypothetical protein